LKLKNLKTEKNSLNGYTSKAMLCMCMLIRVGKEKSIDNYSLERIEFYLNLLIKPNKEITRLMTKEGRKAFQQIIINEKKKRSEEKEEKKKEKQLSHQVDTIINVSQLRTKTFDVFAEEDDSDQVPFKSVFESKTKLGKVIQLTGCNDSIYAEATVNVHEYDIILDILLVNQTKSTLENISIELRTMGDLEVVETPHSYTLGPNTANNVAVNIKVSSTETGTIFGNIVYTISGAGGKRSYIVLNDININIMDYIYPADCSEQNFRKMWRIFEWENKITVKWKESSKTLLEYLKDIISVTKMKSLSPLRKDDNCEFLSSNLHAKSKFGESALLNISIEKSSKNTIEGIIRIRSKTQGIAKSLGKEIKKYQKKFVIDQ
jgi:coatomer subunit beta